MEAVKQATQSERMHMRGADRLWQAITARDARFDGAFVFGVRSTGIYCRPSCPSRRPRRERVVFFERPESAERLGFRACRRCRPNQAGGSNGHTSLVERAVRELEASDGEKISLGELAARLKTSPFHLQRMFKRATGISPRQFAEARRMRRLKNQLKGGSDVTTALYEAGFGSSSRLYERAPEELGMTPATYRKGGAGMKIGYTIAPSPLGKILVAATEKGVSAVYLGEKAAHLERELEKEYPGAEIGRNRNGMRDWVEHILNHLRGQEPKLELPIDVRATAFQKRVWEELRRIPYGKTKTYTQVARAIGRPNAVRAVARACATNPVSVVVPCHRVIREDGSLAGYRWGLNRKQALLEREKRQAG